MKREAVKKSFVLAVCLFRGKLIFFAWEKLTVQLSLLRIRSDPMFVIGKPHWFLHKSNSLQLKVGSDFGLHTFPDQSSRLFRGWHSFKPFVSQPVITQRNNVYHRLFPIFLKNRISRSGLNTNCNPCCLIEQRKQFSLQRPSSKTKTSLLPFAEYFVGVSKFLTGNFASVL